MKSSNNTILITGGSAGIGYEIAKLFSEKGNQVIITGRNQERLDKAASTLKNTTGIVSNVTRGATKSVHNFFIETFIGYKTFAYFAAHLTSPPTPLQGQRGA